MAVAEILLAMLGLAARDSKVSLLGRSMAVRSLAMLLERLRLRCQKKVLPFSFWSEERYDDFQEEPLLVIFDRSSLSSGDPIIHKPSTVHSQSNTI